MTRVKDEQRLQRRKTITEGCGVITVLVLSLICGGCGKNVASANNQDFAKVIYASPGGWSGNDGTLEKPFDLGSALSAKSPIKAGGIVWLRGGTYRGSFVSYLTGTEQAPVVVRPYAGEHVIIDGSKGKEAVLTIDGAWAIYRDIEIMNSDPRRNGTIGPEVNRAIGVDVHGPNTKVVNFVIHDTGTGMGMWIDAVDAEAYGNIIYYNGWKATDRAHGHGIYTQNKDGVRRLTDNVIFRNFGMGVQAYGSNDAYLDSINFEGNVVFNNGILNEIKDPGEPAQNNLLLGGGRVARNPVLKANYTYNNPSAGGPNTFGSDPGCQDLLMQDNYFVGASGYALELVNCAGTIERNSFFGMVRGIEGHTIAGLPQVAAKYPNNSIPTSSDPLANKVSVRPNRFEPGRAHIIVYNWERADAIPVDLTPAGIKVGASFEIRDVQNLSAPPVVSGTFVGRPVSIPLKSLTTLEPVVGWEASGWKTLPSHTAPQFVVFLVTSSAEEPSALASLFARMRGFVGL